MEDRIESAKAGALAAVAGSLAATPVGALLPVPGVLTPQWEWDSDTLAASLALFGLVYRYATRSDADNDMLKQGAVGAFAITRVLASVRVGEQCTALPLECGPPLGYFDWAMLSQLASAGAHAAAAYGGAALAIEAAFDKGLLARVPGRMDGE